MAKIKRIYHHCSKLEEAPMWGNCKPSERDELIQKSYELLSNPAAFKSACLMVLSEWPFSVEHNLSARVQNRVAWMGWAACCVSHNSTEYTTRNAWRFLTEEQKQVANEMASQVIKEWESCQK